MDGCRLVTLPTEWTAALVDSAAGQVAEGSGPHGERAQERERRGDGGVPRLSAVHKRTTQKLVAPIRVVLNGTAVQVRQAAQQQVFDPYEPRRGLLSSGEKLWLHGADANAFSVVYGSPVKKEPNTVVRSWKVDIKVRPDETATMVDFEMVAWRKRRTRSWYSRATPGLPRSVFRPSAYHRSVNAGARRIAK